MTRADLRCAIYTRKSSEEGLEQDFNSLHAQREACEAYIRSQAAEGWCILPETFDDGGQSGGTLDRPSLEMLLSAVRKRRVDVIVIYKVDRLTRSLADFAKLADMLDEYGVSFVSVTQQFNSTTSMGRLMLNVLLSFAQFEREVTGERIRDKIAASKKKGLWMGGLPPLGYEVRDRALVIDEEEAATARTIFALYLQLGTVAQLEAELARRHIHTRIRTLSNGRQVGGRAINKPILYKLLSNPLYIGRTRHKEKTYPGAHGAIIDMQTWEAVQAQLAQNTQGPRKRQHRGVQEVGMLTGLLYDDRGNRFILNHAKKGTKRYRYYVEKRNTEDTDAKPAKLRRIPAKELDRIIRAAICDLVEEPMKLIETLKLSASDEMTLAMQRAERLRHSLDQRFADTWHQVIAPTLQRVTFRMDGITVQFDRNTLRAQLGLCEMAREPGHEAEAVDLHLPVRIKTRGAQLKLILPDGSWQNTPPQYDHALIRVVARAHDWFEQLITGKAPSINAVAKAEGVTRSYITRMIRLAFLPPHTVEQLLEGKQSPDITLEMEIPLKWT